MEETNMSKTVGRLLWLVLLAVFFLGFAYPDRAFALWAKRYDNNGWRDIGAVWPTDAGGYYLWGSTSDPAEAVLERKTHLLLAKLAATGNVQWANRIDTGDFDHFFLSELSGNNVFIQGWTSTTFTGDSDAVWAKFTVDAGTGAMTPVFQKAFKGTGSDTLSFAVSEGGNFDIGVGTTYAFSGSTEDRDMLIVKLNAASGNIDWSKVLHHGSQDSVPNLTPLAGGGFMLSAAVASASGSGSDILVSKLGSTGAPEWAKVYVGTGTNTASLYEISGGYLLVGSTMIMTISPPSYSFEYNIFVIKINASGTVQWQKKYSSGSMMSPYMAFVNPDGSFTLTGNIVESGTNRNKILLLNISSTGAILSQKTLGGAGDDYGNFVKANDGGYYFTGGSTSFSTGDADSDALFGKFDANFSPQWVKTFGGDKQETATYYQSPSNNAYILTGETESFGAEGGDGVMDIFAVTLNATADYPECYLKDVTLSETTPDVTVTDLGWTEQTTTLTQRAHAMTLADIVLTIMPITLTATDICTGSSEEGTLSVTPADGLTSSGTQGGAFTPTSAVFTLENTGTTAIDWTAAKNETWLTLSATSGTLAAGATATVTVSLNSGANSLDAGAYSDTVTVTNTTNGSGTTTRSVALTVNAPEPGSLSVTPSDGFTSSGTQGGPFSPANKQFTLENTGSSAVAWTAGKGQSWVTLSATGGTLNAGASTTVTVSLGSGANGLAAGGYSDTVTFTNSTNGSGSTTRGVALTVNAPGPGVLSVEVFDDFVASGTRGGPFNPASKQFTLRNTGASAITWAAGKGQSWLTLSSAGGTLNAGASTTVTVSLNSGANGLATGKHADTVTFTNGTNGNGNTTRNVDLTVNPTPGILSVAPVAALASSGLPGGPFAPLDQTYTLTNTGETSIDWTATKGQDWTTLSSTGGTLSAGASTTVIVSINDAANSRAAGAYSDTVSFTNTTNGNGSGARAVNLTVQGGLSVTDGEGLSSSGLEGGPFDPASKDYTLTNTGTTSINWSAAKTQKWVKLSKTSGKLDAGASFTVTVSIDAKSAGALSDGAFADTVTFTNKTNNVGDTTRNAALAVQAVALTLVSPADGADFTVCSYYPPSGPPVFQWETSGTLKSLELQFYNTAVSTKVTKVKANADQLAQKSLQITASNWKKIFLIPGTNGGTVSWKAVGTKLNKLKEESEERSFAVAAPAAVGDPQIAPTSKTTPPLPVLSWNNNCASKFKVWFYNDQGYYDDPKKSGVKKKSFSFTDTDPTDSSGVFSKELTDGQWTAIQNVVGKTSGSTIYWHVESSDVVSTKRIGKTSPQQFTLGD
jgi:hypothetical protein